MSMINYYQGNNSLVIQGGFDNVLRGLSGQQALMRINLIGIYLAVMSLVLGAVEVRVGLWRLEVAF
jgi:hypothetical protein